MALRLFIICPLLWGLGSVPEGFALETRSFIWWAAAPAERLADGTARQLLTLTALPGSTLESQEVFFRLTPLKRFNQAGEAKEARWFKGEWRPDEALTMELRAGEYVRAEVFAKAVIDGREHFAQTTLMLFGQSGQDFPVALKAEKPDWPEFSVAVGGAIYWPQTGHEFSVEFQRAEPATKLEVVSAQGEILAELAASSGLFKYTPPRDPALDQAGYAASKPLIFLARDMRGGSASFAIAIHRSRVAGLDEKSGLMIFAAAFLLTALLAAWARRKAAPCF